MLLGVMVEVEDEMLLIEICAVNELELDRKTLQD